jgi:hypothetical protein
MDSWVALSEDESKIVAIGSSYEDAVNKSEAARASDPASVKTPKDWLPLFVWA